MMHPVGPHAAQTYWLRRTVVGLVALALVAGLVWWALGRGSGPGPDLSGAASTETTSAQLTGVLATEMHADGSTTDDSDTDLFGAGTLSGDTADPGAADSDATASDATDSDAAADASGSGTAAETATSGTDAAATATAAAASTAAATKTGAAAPATAASGTTAASTAPSPGTKSGTSHSVAEVVETTKPARVTVTVTKLVPATGTAVKSTAPTTTAPPKPSYDSAGRLICPASSIGLSGVVWGTVAGQQPRLGMNVTNTGKQTCRQDVSGAEQVYTVFTAAGARVWSTADCFPGEGHEVRTLASGQKASFVIRWSGTTSEPGCDAPRVKVKAGKYTLVVQLGAIKSKPLPFTMH